jgi:hypothetical protein
VCADVIQRHLRAFPRTDPENGSVFVPDTNVALRPSKLVVGFDGALEKEVT